jgi:general secretion pathway protein N
MSAPLPPARPPRRHRYALTFITLLLCSLLIQWPAAWLAPWLERASHGHWRLVLTSGTLWSGAGMLLVNQGNTPRWQDAQSLRWQLDARQLWRGQLKLQLEFEQGATRLILNPQGYALEATNTQLPAHLLGALLPGALGRYGWGGQLQVRGNAAPGQPDLSCPWPGHTCNGQIELRWQEARITEVGGPPLGNYLLRLSGEGPALRLELSTLPSPDGRLKLDGQGEVSGNALRFDGSAEALQPDTPDGQSLDRLLATLGRRVGNGQYRLRYQDQGNDIPASQR